MPSLKEKTVISNVEQYLAELRKELAGSDRATIQDALADAEEYLRNALGNAPTLNGTDTLAAVIGKYGTPAEIAAAYQQIESRTQPAFASRMDIEPQVLSEEKEPAVIDIRPWYVRFFGVFAEPRAWASLLYLLFALVTGIIYFTWAVTGISVSAGLLVLIIGLPIAGLFLLSVKGIALVEGRLVEALLGVRMPRRQRFSEKKPGLWNSFKRLISDERVWFSMIYMVLQLPLGVIYFSVLVALIATAFGLVVWPILSVAMSLPVIVTPSHAYVATGWLVPVTAIAGVLLVTATMHLAKAAGKMHGLLARALLVRP
jgi:hypothetical protein